MPCVRCNHDLAADAVYCPACGARQDRAHSWSSRRLVRIPSERRIAGVCAGMADYLDLDVSLVRALWLAFSIVPGAIVGGVLAYVLAWVVMPEGRPTRAAVGRRLVRSTSDAKIGGVCAGLADYVGVDATLMRVAWIILAVVPGAFLGGALAYLAAWLIIPKAPAVLSQHEPHAA